MWAQDANGPAGTKTWADALTYCNNLTLGSYTDWRLPNIKELSSLIDWAYSNPALSNAAGTAKWTSGDAFTGVQSSYDKYWSATSYADFAFYAWLVDMYDGGVSLGNKTDPWYVWPVRGGQ